MKKLCCMVALAAISFGTVFAHGNFTGVKSATMQSDTTKKKMKKKMPMKKKKMKKDTMSNM
ncbi:hypothetical protein HH214_12355 [Mucilaginibacter robiniae]|uniref:Pentapeptide MXKDX repeat protein n=1 Tax=Mucilaginibacter robiniae TaxID=2728022 RepID=A0A7L5E055_9SPHI|nr:hypothetical protein [Mucilaginibacter robiniae]QJD96615.1 hypothetical protein HH214_12355 [Mucilaginibacter robiniae]